jgi:hypothetical protein
VILVHFFVEFDREVRISDPPFRHPAFAAFQFIVSHAPILPRREEGWKAASLAGSGPFSVPIALSAGGAELT